MGRKNLSELEGANRGSFACEAALLRCVENLPGSGGGSRRPTGRPLARASVGFFARKSKPAVAGRPFRRSRHKSFGGPSAFPRRLARFSSERESNSALRQGRPGGTTEVSSPQTGLVSPKAGATERRKLRRDSAAPHLKMWELPGKKSGIVNEVDYEVV